MSALDVAGVRAQFPGLARTVAGRTAAFFDGPAGSQVPQRVIDAVADHLAHRNANTHGRFVTSAECDRMMNEAGRAFADFFGTGDPDAVVFGPNMTTLALSLSRALAATWKPGDEVVVTRLDHDANVTPWVLAARDAGATVRSVGFRAEDTTLDIDALAAAIGERTRLVAVAAASNATGTVNPIAEIAGLAHAAGAELFVDAVHYAPHRIIDVDSWGCDYLACSAYKFFGPHLGVLWGRRERLAELPAYQVRAAGDALPEKWMTGTSCHEGIAGAREAVEYLADLGAGGAEKTDRRSRLEDAYRAIAAHEEALLERLLRGLADIPAVTVWGIRDPARLAERAPTISLTHARRGAGDLAAELGRRGLFTWDGHYYALDVVSELGLEPDGMLRVGILHYNTEEEVDRLLDELDRI